MPVASVDLRFDTLTAQGVLRGDRLAIKRARAVLYGGNVAGEATLGRITSYNVCYTKLLRLQAFENQDYQFEDLVDKLDLRRDMSRNPLFDVMLVLQNMSFEDRRVEGIEVEPYEYEKTASKFDITLSGVESNGNLFFDLEYSTALFKKETIERMISHFIV